MSRQQAAEDISEVVIQFLSPRELWKMSSLSPGLSQRVIEELKTRPTDDNVYILDYLITNSPETAKTFVEEIAKFTDKHYKAYAKRAILLGYTKLALQLLDKVTLDVKEKRHYLGLAFDMGDVEIYKALYDPDALPRFSLPNPSSVGKHIVPAGDARLDMQLNNELKAVALIASTKPAEEYRDFVSSVEMQDRLYDALFYTAIRLSCYSKLMTILKHDLNDDEPSSFNVSVVYRKILDELKGQGITTKQLSVVRKALDVAIKYDDKLAMKAIVEYLDTERILEVYRLPPRIAMVVKSFSPIVESQDPIFVGPLLRAHNRGLKLGSGKGILKYNNPATIYMFDKYGETEVAMPTGNALDPGSEIAPVAPEKYNIVRINEETVHAMDRKNPESLDIGIFCRAIVDEHESAANYLIFDSTAANKKDVSKSKEFLFANIVDCLICKGWRITLQRVVSNVVEARKYVQEYRKELAHIAEVFQKDTSIVDSVS